MTGEVTDRFNKITLFGMALFWQKAIDIFTKFIIHLLTYRVERLFNLEFCCLAKAIGFFTNCYKIHFLTYRVERLFNPEFCYLLVLQISFRLGGIWIVGSQVNAQLRDWWPRIV